MGRYSLIEELGRGGMGIVYLAHEVARDNRFARPSLEGRPRDLPAPLPHSTLPLSPRAKEFSMKRSTIGRVVAVFGLALAAGVSAKLESRRDVSQMVDGATALIESLSDEQRTRGVYAFDDTEERFNFHFVPGEVFERHGVSLKEMNSEQKARTHALLGTGLSQSGHMTAMEIIELEGILQAVEAGSTQFSRDPELYLMSVFGTPSTDGTWGWRFEGHHLSLHFTIVDGDLTVSAPTFLATSPATVMDGPRKGLRPLAAQEDAGRALLASLTPAQREAAIIDDVAPTNIVTGVAVEVDPLSPTGVMASDFSREQRGLLRELILSYVNVMSEDIAALRLAGVRDGGIDGIGFAWAGGTEVGTVGYYRVQGPSFLIEFDYTARDPNHVHSAWRDFDGDFGRDVLMEHLQQTRH